MSFPKGVRTDFLSALSSEGSWVLGFVLGRFLDYLTKLAEDLSKKKENTVKIGGVWGRGVAPPARAAKNMPKVSQEAPEFIQKPPKIEPWPPQNRRQNSLKRGPEAMSY